MTIIVKAITRLTVGLIFIYGIYITLTGKDGPGSGFAGGIIIALSFIHVMLAYGREAGMKRLNITRDLALTIAAAAAFLGLTTISFLELSNRQFLAWSELSITVMVGAGVFVVFLALVLLVGGQNKQ